MANHHPRCSGRDDAQRYAAHVAVSVLDPDGSRGVTVDVRRTRFPGGGLASPTMPIAISYRGTTTEGGVTRRITIDPPFVERYISDWKVNVGRRTLACALARRH